jgi:hypothetical protein
MTAEIVIMNKEAVAIAADSAVSLRMVPTNRPQKIFTSANKIFPLSSDHSLCIMIYNNATFMAIPWETIIAAYRKHLGKTTFPTIKEYVEHFIDFLAKDKELIPGEIEDMFFVSTIYSYYLFLRDLIQKNAVHLVRTKGAITQEEIQEIVTRIVGDIHERLTNAPDLPQIKEGQAASLASDFAEEIGKAIVQVFEQIPINDSDIEKLREIVILFFTKDTGPVSPLSQNNSGVVITGFGEKDIFPSLVSLSMWGRVKDLLKFTIDEHQQITFENGAIIVPFAQREMVDIFLSGMDQRMVDALLGSLSQTFHLHTEALINSIENLSEKEKDALQASYLPKVDDIVKQLSVELKNYRATNFIPIINVVASQPKHELASMAESLVNLTSLKRRISLQAETVGGPVDVAVISKGDGFVWVKKKQYFNPELNSKLAVHGEAGAEHV